VSSTDTCHEVPIDMAELETGFSNGWVIHDREKSRRIGHHGSIEERLVMIEKVD
jgi:hypothetical protein